MGNTLRRYAVATLALALTTCQLADEHVSNGPADAGYALLALNLDDAVFSPAPDGQSPMQAVELHVAGRKVATCSFPADGAALEGRAAWRLAAQRPTTVSVVLSNGVEHVPSESIVVDASSEQVLRVRLRRQRDHKTGSAAYVLEMEGETLLDEEDGATVDFTDTNRQQATLRRFGLGAASQLFAILADPEVAVVTPLRDNATSEDHIGPLVAFRAAAGAQPPTSNKPGASAKRPAPSHRDTSSGDSTATSTRSSTSEHRLLPPADRTPATSLSPQPAFIYYYSYCSCGKPVKHRAYTLQGRDSHGEPVQWLGSTDLFGMIHAREVRDANVNFGAGQRARKRSYAFVAGTDQTRQHIRRALQHEDPQEQLTALLDLRRQPLPDAEPELRRLLTSDNDVIWRNAAVTLSYYEDVDDLVASYAAKLLRRDNDRERAAFVLGALRRPLALRPLGMVLTSDDAALRRVAVWALGFIAGAEAAHFARPMLDDPNPMVRAEAAQALGRIGDAASLESLEALLGDTSSHVARSAREAIDRLNL